MLDDQGRTWSGDYHRQRIIEQRIVRVIDGKNIVDISAAVGSIMGNMIADFASDRESALRGLDAFAADTREVIEARFAAKATVN